MTTATLYGKWDVTFPRLDPDNPWFLDWVLRSPSQVSRHLTAGYHAYDQLRRLGIRVDRALECFGGIGGQSYLIRRFWSPAQHVVWDYSRPAVEYLRDAVPAATVQQRDSYNTPLPFPPDLVGLDFGDLTVRRTLPGEPQRGLLDRVLTNYRPRAVVITDITDITDIAGPRLGLQRANYERILGPGTCADYLTYLNSLVQWVRNTYGYRLLAGYHHHWSTVMAFTPADFDDPQYGLLPTPTDPTGLELHR